MHTRGENAPSSLKREQKDWETYQGHNSQVILEKTRVGGGKQDTGPPMEGNDSEEIAYGKME